MDVVSSLRTLAYRAYAATSPWYRAGGLADHRRLLSASQRWSKEAIEGWQLHRLRRLLAAAESTRFHAPRLRDAGMSGATIASMREIEHVPLLHKDDILRDPSALHVVDPPRYRPGASSGTTGRPLRVRTPAEMDAAGRAARWRMIEWFGVPFGAPTMSFTGGNQRRDLRLAATWGFSAHVLGQGFTDAFRNPFEHDLALIERVRPRVVIGYPNVLVQLARTARDRGVDLRRFGVRLVMLGGETIGAEQRAIVGDAFGARVASLYGSHEGHFMATECPHGALHVTEPVIVEVVDERGAPCAEGELGDVAITPLFGLAMPLVRYLLGDRGRLYRRPCPCGFSQPHLALDLCRVSDMIVTRTGRRISSQFLQPILHHHFGAALGVDPIAYRIAQVSIDRLRIEVQLPPGATLPARAQAFVDERARPVLRGELSVVVARVDRVAEDRSGKLRCFVPLDESSAVASRR